MKWAVAVLGILAWTCHPSGPPTARSGSSTGLAPCPEGLSAGLGVEAVLALPVKKRHEAVVVSGYLVLAPGPCTMMNCPDGGAGCNSCQNEIRLGVSPRASTNSIRLQSRDVDYTCWSNSRNACSVDARGQRVIVRGTLVTSDGGPELTSLDDPELCEL